MRDGCFDSRRYKICTKRIIIAAYATLMAQQYTPIPLKLEEDDLTENHEIVYVAENSETFFSDVVETVKLQTNYFLGSVPKV